jgi:hypothetical protein
MAVILASIFLAAVSIFFISYVFIKPMLFATVSWRLLLASCLLFLFVSIWGLITRQSAMNFLIDHPHVPRTIGALIGSVAALLAFIAIIVRRR